MLTSSRRGIVYPNTTRSDSSDVPRDFASMVAALEIDVIYGQGTLAARPVSSGGSPGIQGRVYFATDTSPMTLYYDYGTGWQSIGALSAGSVGTTQLADGSVVGGTGVGAKIAATTIIAANIANGTITATQIANGTITATQLSSALSPAGGAGAGTEALRALGTAAGTAAAGTHASQHSRTGADPLVISSFIASGTLAARPATSLVSGQQYTATDVGGGQTYVYNGSSWLVTGPSVAAQSLSASGTFTGKNNGALTAITLNAVVFDDIGSCISTVNAYCTLPLAGRYLVTCWGVLSGQSGTGQGALQLDRYNSSGVLQENLGATNFPSVNTAEPGPATIVAAAANDRIVISESNGATGSAGSMAGRISIMTI